MQSIGGSLSKLMEDRVITSDEVCEIHGEHLISIRMPDKIGEPFCPSCHKEQQGRDEAEEMKRWAAQLARQKTYDVLNRESKDLFSDKTVAAATFNSFKAETGSDEEKAKKWAIEQAVFYVNGNEGNAVLTGDAGSGKSHLAMSIAKYVNERREQCGQPVSVIFANYSRVISLVTDAIKNKEYGRYERENMLRLLKSPYLLILDDIGMEKTTDFNENFLCDLLDGRTRTVIATNYSSKELDGIYHPRTVSRILRGLGKRAFVFDGISDKRVRAF